MDIEADVIALDLYETPLAMIEFFHANGKKVICYINAGAWEEYRSDARQFSRDVIGNATIGWEGENWLDISRYEIFADIISARFDLAAEKGCDGSIRTISTDTSRTPDSISLSTIRLCTTCGFIDRRTSAG